MIKPPKDKLAKYNVELEIIDNQDIEKAEFLYKQAVSAKKITWKELTVIYLVATASLISGMCAAAYQSLYIFPTLLVGNITLILLISRTFKIIKLKNMKEKDYNQCIRRLAAKTNNT